MMKNQFVPNTFPMHLNHMVQQNQYVPMNNTPRRNYIIPKICKTYNAYLIDQGFQMGNSIKIPQMFDTPPNFMHDNYMFDEIVGVRDENREHSIELIRNMMKHILE